jgi:hypothetical protein
VPPKTPEKSTGEGGRRVTLLRCPTTGGVSLERIVFATLGVWLGLVPPVARADTAALVTVGNAAERRRVLDATFPRYLSARCPKVPGIEDANTWVARDELQAETSAKGLFIPRGIQRVHGSFTRPHARETLYAIELEECVVNGFRHYVEVVFDEHDMKTALVHTHVFLTRELVTTRTDADGVDSVLVRSGAAVGWERLR